jgi:hypothetical protein
MWEDVEDMSVLMDMWVERMRHMSLCKAAARVCVDGGGFILRVWKMSACGTEFLIRQ